jgi:hypothetical protein
VGSGVTCCNSRWLRLRNDINVAILAGSLVLSATGCWAVWGPLIGVGAAGAGAAGEAVVARETKSTARPSTTYAADQADAGRSPPAPTTQVALALTNSPTALGDREPIVSAPERATSKPLSRRRHTRPVTSSRKSRRKRQVKLSTQVIVFTASGGSGDLPPTSICVAVP